MTPTDQPTRWRCPYCSHTFAADAGQQCPSCRRMMRIPRHYQMNPDDIERQRLARMARDRHNERQALRRKAMRSLGLSRRSWMLICLAALVLLGILLPTQYARGRVRTAPAPSHEVRAIKSLWSLRTALEGYHDDCGHYPSTDEGLQALVEPPTGVSGWRGPYIDLLRPDPWHNPFHYGLTTNGTLTLFSTGPDGKPDTGDDIPAPRPDLSILKQRRKALASGGAQPAPDYTVSLKP